MRQDFLILNCTLILLQNYSHKQPRVLLFLKISSMSGLKRRIFVDISNHSLTAIGPSVLPPPKQLLHCVLVADFHH